MIILLCALILVSIPEESSGLKIMKKKLFKKKIIIIGSVARLFFSLLRRTTPYNSLLFVVNLLLLFSFFHQILVSSSTLVPFVLKFVSKPVLLTLCLIITINIISLHPLFTGLTHDLFCNFLLSSLHLRCFRPMCVCRRKRRSIQDGESEFGSDQVKEHKRKCKHIILRSFDFQMNFSLFFGLVIYRPFVINLLFGD